MTYDELFDEVRDIFLDFIGEKNMVNFSTPEQVFLMNALIYLNTKFIDAQLSGQKPEHREAFLEDFFYDIRSGLRSLPGDETCHSNQP